MMLILSHMMSHDADTKSHDALLSHMISIKPTIYTLLLCDLSYCDVTWQLSDTSTAHRQTGEVSKPKKTIKMPLDKQARC